MCQARTPAERQKAACQTCNWPAHVPHPHLPLARAVVLELFQQWVHTTSTGGTAVVHAPTAAAQALVAAQAAVQPVWSSATGAAVAAVAAKAGVGLHVQAGPRNSVSMEACGMKESSCWQRNQRTAMSARQHTIGHRAGACLSLLSLLRVTAQLSAQTQTTNHMQKVHDCCTV